jgi:hypothetical protein
MSSKGTVSWNCSLFCYSYSQLTPRCFHHQALGLPIIYTTKIGSQRTFWCQIHQNVKTPPPSSGEFTAGDLDTVMHSPLRVKVPCMFTIGTVGTKKKRFGRLPCTVANMYTVNRLLDDEYNRGSRLQRVEILTSLCVWEKLFDEKKSETKLSWHSPFKSKKER